MSRHWPIRYKLLAGLVLVLSMTGILLAAAFFGLYSYRVSVRTFVKKSQELERTGALWQAIADLSQPAMVQPPVQPGNQRNVLNGLQQQLAVVRDCLERYYELVQGNVDRMRDPDLGESELELVKQMRGLLHQLGTDIASARSAKTDPTAGSTQTETDLDTGIAAKVNALGRLASQLPRLLKQDLREQADDALWDYRRSINISIVTGVLVVVMMVSLVRLVYRWVFRPIRRLHEGAAEVIGGNFDYRIQLRTHDEMQELAQAFNEMTARFQSINQDLERKVNDRSRQLVRSERLASVGFLAAGVAHEINNPLASIAMCSEALEGRLNGILGQANGDSEVIHNYLRMIQAEAFRCKGITEKLLDFSRMGGDSQRQSTDLVSLVLEVIGLIQHIGKYRGKHIEFRPTSSVMADVNPQEIKQVILNLVVNALDSMDPDGTLRVHVRLKSSQAEMVLTDDGCGMAPEVLENIFEPFFTRRRDGKGTGLGLSISHRIVSQHGGEIEASSKGPGRGSTFLVRLPVHPPTTAKETVREHAEPQAIADSVRG